jgi:TadE-like protein
MTEEFQAERGAVYVEFLLVVPPLLLLFFGLTQIGLMYGAHLLVGHAAGRSARAAIVILPDENTDEYADVPMLQIGDGGDGLETYKNAPSEGRLDQVRLAARIVLSSISPSIEGLLADNLTDALGDHGAISSLVGLVGWTEYAVAVTFPDGAGGYRTSFTPLGPVTVRVTYLYKCVVPVARGILCHDFGDLNQRAREEFASGSVNSLLAISSDMLGWRFLALVSDRTLPNQGK